MIDVTPIKTADLTDEDLKRSLASSICPNGAHPKRPGNVLCLRCFRALPSEKRFALYRKPWSRDPVMAALRFHQVGVAQMPAISATTERK